MSDTVELKVGQVWHPTRPKDRTVARQIVNGTRGDNVWSRSANSPNVVCWNRRKWLAWVADHGAMPRQDGDAP